MRRKIFSFIFVLFVLFLFWIAWQKFINLKIWAVNEINIEGNVIIPTKTLEDKLECFIGQSIFSIKNKDVKVKVIEISQLQDIKVKHEFPQKIVISIIERKPFANLFYGKKNFIVDDEGYILNKPGMLIADTENLPVVKKIKESDIIGNTFLKKRYVDVVKEIIYGLRGVVSAKDLQIDLNDLHNIVIFLNESTKVKLGDREDLPDKLRKLNYFISLKSININQLDYIDVRFGENVVVKYNQVIPQKNEKDI